MLVSSFLSNLLHKSDIMIKKKQSKTLILTYIGAFLFLLLFASNMGDLLNNSKNISSKEVITYEDNLKNLKNSGYWTLPNITIDDLNFNNWAWAATKDWCSGTGILGDPYIIENVTIKNSSEGIFIRDSIKYFVVRNVTVYNITISGIRLNNVTNSVFFDNNISSNILWGIYLTMGSKNNLFKENFIFNNTNDGILLTNLSNNNTIIENIIKNNTQHGISLDGSNKNLIKGNTINNNTGMGISITLQSNNNTISENDVNNGLWDGVYIENSVDNIVSRNNITYNSGDGIFLSGSSNDTTVNENTLNLNNQGIHLMNNFNNTIKDNTINNSTYAGIFLVNCDFTKILGNLLNNNKGDGMSLDASNDNFIEENFINNNQGDGILLTASSNNNTIKTNTIIDNRYGIDLADSEENDFIENIINSSLYAGIYLYNGNFSKVIGNIIHNNTQSGIDLELIYNGIIAENTIYNNLQHGINGFLDIYYTNITSNNIYNNNLAGIYIESSSSNDVTRNRIESNVIYGVHIANPQSKYNLFSYNFFIGNGRHAYDDGLDNNWNSSVIGNYWDNYTGTDANNDGIGDTAYILHPEWLPGKKINDSLPIYDVSAPSITIDSPSSNDLFGTNAPDFNIVVTDHYLESIWYVVGGGSNNLINTTTGTINQGLWDTFGSGTISITFYANDSLSQVRSTSVTVKKDITTPIINIITPSQGDTFGSTAPSFIVEIIEENLDTMWYTLEGGANIMFTVNGTFNSTEWSLLSDGQVTITFYARDLLGNIGSQSVNVEISFPQPGGIISGYNLLFMSSLIVFSISVILIIINRRQRHIKI